MHILNLVTLSVTAGICVSCASTDFRGDGKFIDHGPFAAMDRYVVDLGPIDLTKPGKYAFSISNLPHETFIIGLEVADQEPNNSAGSRLLHTGRIHLVVENSDRKLVVDESRALDSWTRSSSRLDTKSFLYASGREQDPPKAGFGIKADQGWGTYFLPKAREQYQLRVDVLEVQATSLPLRLILKGGGWK